MKKFILIVLAVAATLGLLIGGWLLWQNCQKEASPFNQAVKNSTFPIYTPTKLPEGYMIDQTSISLTSQALLFTAKSQDGASTLIFTETPVPAEYDFESFYKTRFVGAQDVTSLYGRGKIGIMDGMMSGSLATDSTWILVKGPENLPANEMKSIIEKLKPVD